VVSFFQVKDFFLPVLSYGLSNKENNTLYFNSLELIFGQRKIFLKKQLGKHKNQGI